MFLLFNREGDGKAGRQGARGERERYTSGGHVLWQKLASMVSPFFPKLKLTMIRNEIVLKKSKPTIAKTYLS